MNEKLYKLPPSFIVKIKRIYPDNYREITETFLQKKITTFRINYNKTDLITLREDLRKYKIKAKELDFPKGAFLSKTTLKDIQKTDLYNDGHIYVQNASSMIPALVLDPKKGERILDMCAAPGTKTTQIISLAPDVELQAIEKSRIRFYKLLANVKVQGAGNLVKVHLMDGTLVRKKFPLYFDKILLDAPCSTEGRFYVENPKSFSYWRDSKVKEMVRTQKKLIYAAFYALREGGELVYSTCTFSPEENEGIVDYFLNKFKNKVELMSIDFKLDNSHPGLTKWRDTKYSSVIGRCRRVIPNDYLEGFFVARIKKIAE